MFKHLLIPTDGTKLSEAAVRAGVLLAREQGAKVTGLYVMPDYRAIIYGADAADLQQRRVRAKCQQRCRCGFAVR
jgi:nucleotide-binding universal stress UspA family protein